MTGVLVQYVCLASLVCLMACSGTTTRTPVEPLPWVAGEDCADSAAQLASVPMPTTQQPIWKGEFRDVATCLRSGNQVEPVLLLDLRQIKPVSLDVQLDLHGQVLLGARVRLLDDQFNTQQDKVFDDFTQRPDHFSLRIYPQANAGDAAYLLIGPDPQAIGGQLDLISGRRVVSVWAGGGYMGAVADGVEDQQRIGIRDAGELSVIAESNAPVSSERSPGD